jgi:uncharacterized protein
MARSEARITIEGPSRYLQQLCRHFAPKLPTTHTRQRGQIVFATGTCKLEAQDDLLIMAVEAEDEASVARLEELVARHLECLAFHRRPTISWASLEGLKF